MPTFFPTKNQQPTTTTKLPSLTTFILIGFIACSGCRGQKNISRGEAPDLQTLADEALGVDNSIELNESKTFVLCFQTPTSDHARRKYRYIVVAIPNLSVVHEGVFNMGSVRWVDDESIEVVSGSTSVQGSSTTRIIDVTSTPQ
jgi:hypothetical protein